MSGVDQDLAVRLVDALNVLYGAHPGHRAAHAKGSYYQATFTPTAEAAGLSRAPHFRGGGVPALVRFSNGSGNPQSHDGTADGRGMAVKFDLGGGTSTDIVALTLPLFFARTPEAFLAFTEARTPDPQTGQPDMARFMAFLGEHPEAGAAVQAAMAARPPQSFAQLSFNSIHSFRLLDAAGGSRFVRYRWIPEAGEAFIEPEDARSRDADYLASDMAERLDAGPVVFRLLAILATPDDDVDDPTVAWPADHETVELGRLEISAVAADPEGDGAVVVFDPTNVVDGIECSDDQILHARNAAYSESVNRRLR
jgi:catalase